MLKKLHPHITKLKQKLFSTKQRAILSIFIFLIVGVGISVMYNHFAKGATYGWLQSSWVGNADTLSTANHTNNQNNWNKFFSKNDNIVANDKITLDSANSTRTDASTEDFQTGTTTNGVYPIINSDGELKLNVPACNTTIADAGADQTGAPTCGLTTVTLNGNAPTVGTGTWTKVSGTGGTFANANLRNTTFTGTAGLTYVLRWTISNAPCPASIDDVTITFNRNPTVANAGVDQNLACSVLSATLAGNAPSIGTGTWSVISGTATITTPTSRTSTVTGLVAGTSVTLRWTVSNSPCNAYSDDVIITTPNAPACGETVTFNSVTYGTVYSTCKCWLDRNLGATQAAASSTDVLAYGDLYQWGRGTDGHEKRTSGTTTTLSNSDTPGHGNFILAPNSPYDWRSPQNVNLWQGVGGTNNPCPSGFRLPTLAEWNTELASWSSQSQTGAFASPLKLSMTGGERYYVNGSLLWPGGGYYWSSTVPGNVYAMILSFGTNFANMSGDARASAASVRCIKD